MRTASTSAPATAPRTTATKATASTANTTKATASTANTTKATASTAVDADSDRSTPAGTPPDAPLGTVTGDAPLETKPAARPQRSAKHELVDDARRQRRIARRRTTKRHPGRGLFGGVLVGAGVSAMLVLYGFLPLGEATLAAPVVVFAVVGFLIGTRGPVRGRRPATATMHVPDSPTLTGITPITPLTTTATADPDAHRMSGSEDLGTVFGPTGRDDDAV